MSWEKISFFLFQLIALGIFGGVFIFLLQRVLLRTIEPKPLNSNYLTLSDYNKLTDRLKTELEQEYRSDLKLLSTRLDFLENRLEKIESILTELQKEIKNLTKEFYSSNE